MKAMVTAVKDRKENSQDDNINYLGPILKKDILYSIQSR